MPSAGPTFALAATLLAATLPGVALAQGVEGLPRPAETSYRGRKVVVDLTGRGPHVTSMTVLCSPGGLERREFHATRGLIIVDGRSSWQYLPEQGVVVKRPSRGDGGELLRPEQVRRALVSYEVRVSPAGLVAGRRSQALEFLPRQSGTRPRRRVWVDAETGLILRTEVYGTDSRLAWLAVFEDLEYRPAFDGAAFTMQVPPGARVVEAAPEPCLEPAEAERLAGLPLSLPGYLPEGFTRQCITARRQRDYKEIQVTFSDGLSLLSLFQSTAFRPPGGASVTQPVVVGPWPGLWHDLGSVTGISWRAPWATLALLGELSRAELYRIAGSVRLRPELSRPASHP